MGCAVCPAGRQSPFAFPQEGLRISYFSMRYTRVWRGMRKKAAACVWFQSLRSSASTTASRSRASREYPSSGRLRTALLSFFSPCRILGGRSASSVSGNTDYLVRGEDPGQKLQDAEREGVKILDEGEFRKMIGS